MKCYTVWYIKDGKRTVWATGLTKEEAESAFETIIKEFGLTTGIRKNDYNL